MSVSRRTLLKGTVAVSAATAVPALAADARQTLTVYDSRIPESQAFARRASRTLDVAHLDATRWADLRGDINGVRRVTGLTGWTDWIIARGFLEERGLRMTTEARVKAPISTKAHLFKWEMAAHNLSI
jgi:TAT (twin-arginine translocation) pathway signal sequence